LAVSWTTLRADWRSFHQRGSRASWGSGQTRIFVSGKTLWKMSRARREWKGAVTTSRLLGWKPSSLRRVSTSSTVLMWPWPKRRMALRGTPLSARTRR